MRILLPILILAISIAGFMGLIKSKPEKKMVEKPEKVWRVNTVPVVFQTLSPEITLYGRIETPNKSTLKAALVSDVISVTILEGSQVEVGQLLVSLDDTDVQLLLEQRKADLSEINALINSERERFERDKSLLSQEKELLNLADNAVERAKKLEETRLASQSSVDDAIIAKQRQILTVKRLEFDIADHPARLAQLNARKTRSQALIKQAYVDIKRTKIIAPFTGIVSSLMVAKGDRVRAGDSLLSLYDINKLEVRAQIPGRYIHQIRTMMSNEEALLASSNIDSKSYSFAFDRLSGEIKPNSGGIDGLFSLNETDILPLGKFVELQLKLIKQDKVIALPFNALYSLNNIYRLNNDYLQLIQIERIGEYVNARGKKELLIRSDTLQQGDQIVSTQLPNAITGLRVEAMSE